MARKRVWNIDRFDGGMTNDTRNTTDLSKCAFVSHFDIYREPYRLYPLPGYVPDQAVNFGVDVDQDATPDDANGMEKYNCTALFFPVRTTSETTITMAAVGTKTDGTGWKIITKTNPEATCWTPNDIAGIADAAEGTETLVRGTYLTGSSAGSLTPLNFLNINSGKTYIGKWSVTFDPQLAEVYVFAVSNPVAGRMVAEGYFGSTYAQKLLGFKDIWLLDGSPAVAESTSIFPYDIQAGGEQIGYIGGFSNTSSRESRLVLWDTASALVDQNILLGNGTGRALGYIDGNWITVTDEADRTWTDAGIPSFHVQVLVGNIPYTLYRALGKSTTGKKLQPVRASWRGNFLFEGKIATNTAGDEFRHGIWAVGKSTANSPLAVSLLFDATNLGAIEDMKTYDNYAYFIHGDKYSISRTDDLITGTFDETAVYESLFFGSDNPNNKVLNGISVHTENLPSGATIEVKYRVDENDSWTSLGTSTTADQQIHTFTNNIGEFQEIQFRVEVTGNAPIKNIHISLNELDTTPYDS